MWIKVLPCDPTKEVYFHELSDDTVKAWDEIGRLIHGLPEVVKTQTLVDTFGFNYHLGLPEVIMIVNENGQRSGMPINEKASKYYPNEYDVKIRGDAILTGWTVYMDGLDIGADIASMPLKWKVIHDMETALATTEYPGQLRNKLEELLLSVTDPDVRKMYEEAREQMDWRTA